MDDAGLLNVTSRSVDRYQIFGDFCCLHHQFNETSDFEIKVADSSEIFVLLHRVILHNSRGK